MINPVVPVSRFTRELNKWLRYVDKYPEEAIRVTRNGVEEFILMGYDHYNELTGGVKLYEN